MLIRNLVVIDDDPFYHQFITQCLENLFRINCYTNTDIEPDILSGTDIILLDLRLPESDAIVFLEQIKLISPKIELVFISGRDKKTIESAVQVAQFYNFKSVSRLSKPFSCSALAEALYNPIESRHLGNKLLAPVDSQLPVSDIEFQKALGTGQFFCHYQPQVLLDFDQVWGVEALARWNHPSRGLLSPYHFISIANSPAYSAHFFLEILDIAIRDYKDIERKTGLSLNLSVNLSSTALDYFELPEDVARILILHDFPAPKLTIEITEQELSVFDVISTRTIARLRILGVSISMDDFGAGDSGLTKLTNFSFDEIKIDKTLIDDLPNSTDSKTIIRSILDMAIQLDLNIVIEGIETDIQLAWIKTEFPDSKLVAQGYYYSKPVPPSILIDRLRLNNGQFQ